MNRSFQYLFKVGLGFRPEESIPADPLSWALEQLQRPSYFDISSPELIRIHGDVIATSNYELKDRALEFRNWAIRRLKKEEAGQSIDDINRQEADLRDADHQRHILNAIYGDSSRSIRLSIAPLGRGRYLLAVLWLDSFTIITERNPVQALVIKHLGTNRDHQLRRMRVEGTIFHQVQGYLANQLFSQ